MNTNLRKANILNPLDTLDDWINEVKASNTKPATNYISIATIDSNGYTNKRIMI